MRATTIKWEDDSALVRNWIEMRRKNPALTSPYFHPQFTSIVARQCSNVEVAVIEQCNKIAALLDLSGSFDEYVKTRTEVKSLRAKMRRLARDFGSLRMVPVSRDSAAMQQLLRWKSQQYRATAQRDIFEREWIVAVVREVYGHHDPDFGGILSLLYAGDRLVAALLGMRSAGVYHYWFPSYDPAMAHYSPGSILLLMFVEQAKSIGIEMIDLGKNMSEQKRRFMNASTLVAEGAVELSSWRRLRRSLRNDFRSIAI
jgi:CelD/BcsL family acetyltransferase involved in cellulose biosynthesis